MLFTFSLAKVVKAYIYGDVYEETYPHSVTLWHVRLHQVTLWSLHSDIVPHRCAQYKRTNTKLRYYL